MYPSIAIADLKVVPVVELQAGSLFYLVRSGKLRALCMRATLDKVQAFAKLAGEDPFGLYEIRTTDHKAIPLHSHPLCIRIGQRQPDDPNADNPGNLMISADVATVTVRLDGYGGSSQLFGLRLSDGILVRDWSHPACAIANWQLVSRQENGSETVLLTAGEV
jgi:hypothetical protein